MGNAENGNDDVYELSGWNEHDLLEHARAGRKLALIDLGA
jgi:hypothetical protein